MFWHKLLKKTAFAAVVALTFFGTRTLFAAGWGVPADALPAPAYSALLDETLFTSNQYTQPDDLSCRRNADRHSRFFSFGRKRRSLPSGRNRRPERSGSSTRPTDMSGGPHLRAQTRMFPASAHCLRNSSTPLSSSSTSNTTIAPGLTRSRKKPSSRMPTPPMPRPVRQQRFCW